MGARSRSGSEPSADETGLMGLAILLRTPLARRFGFDYIQYFAFCGKSIARVNCKKVSVL